MTRHKTYPVANPIRQLCALLNIEETRVLRRIGLSPDLLDHAGKGVTAREFYALYDAVYQESKREDLAMFLGREFAAGPYQPAMLAFSCSPNIEIGLTRLALFKPLIAPIHLQVQRSPDGVEVQISSSAADAPMPAGIAAFELVFFVECTRRFTAEHIVPLQIRMPEQSCNTEALNAFFGVTAQPADHPGIVLSVTDAERPLLSENAEFWAHAETTLKRQLAEAQAPAMADRVRASLVDLLPGGDATAQAVCRRLNISKRSLQRHLQAEGQSFQTILDRTRSDLSLSYLSKGEMSVEEISYLLAYRDPNSFYRAFQGWTGMTPAQARGQQRH